MVYHGTRLNSLFGALADPTRRAIVARLALGETTVGELARPFPMSLPAIGKHLSVLERARLVARSREGRIHRVRLDARAMHEAATWLEPYRRLWEHQFDRLAEHLGESPLTPEKPSWPPLKHPAPKPSGSSAGSPRRRSASSRRGPRSRS